MTLTIELTDQIPSGKNQIKEHYETDRKTGRPKKVRHGNERFTMWRKAAGMEILIQRSKWPLLQKAALPLPGDLIARVSYRPLDPICRDLPGMQDALWHLLEQMEVIGNDGQIKGLTWDYPWRSDGPCVILTLMTT